MENQEKSGQSCESGCCCTKALLAVLLFLVGGIIGYLMGHHCCCHKRMGPCMTPMVTESHPMPPAWPKTK